MGQQKLKKPYFGRTKTRKGLIKKADDLWAKIIKIRDGYKCQRCQSTHKQLNSCHFYSRAAKSVRWDLKNGVCLCVGCHFFTHQNPAEFVQWFTEWAGEETLNYLKFKRQGKVTTTEFAMQVRISELQEIENEL